MTRTVRIYYAAHEDPRKIRLKHRKKWLDEEKKTFIHETGHAHLALLVMAAAGVQDSLHGGVPCSVNRKSIESFQADHAGRQFHILVDTLKSSHPTESQGFFDDMKRSSEIFYIAYYLKEFGMTSREIRKHRIKTPEWNTDPHDAKMIMVGDYKIKGVPLRAFTDSSSPEVPGQKKDIQSRLDAVYVIYKKYLKNRKRYPDSYTAEAMDFDEAQLTPVYQSMHNVFCSKGKVRYRMDRRSKRLMEVTGCSDINYDLLEQYIIEIGKHYRAISTFRFVLDKPIIDIRRRDVRKLERLADEYGLRFEYRQ